MTERDCAVCGTKFSFVIQGRGRYPMFCSGECKQVAKKAYAQKARQSVVKGDCAQCGQRITEWKRRKFCSADCADKGKLALLALRPYRSRQARPKPVECEWCGRTVMRRVNTTAGRFCSRDCSSAWISSNAKHESTESKRKSWRVAGAQRRARLRDVEREPVDPVRVFERDRWRCHMCGIRTPPERRGTFERNAPEMDHIVTLADGGSHTWGNLACSCRACNIAKAGASLGQIGLPLFSVV